MIDIKIGLIGGSGLGAAVPEQTAGRRHDVETPFGPPSDSIVETSWNDLPVFFLSRHGPGHLLNPSQIPYRANVFALKRLGVTHILATGAVGSLREEFRPRDLVIPDQIIDKTVRRAGTFYDQAAVHVEFAEPFCPILRRILLDAAANPPRGESSPRVHERGCYVAMEGPAFSTRAESLMHRLWGGDLIGMTAMPEAKLAREAEIAYALVALVSDYDSWRGKPADTGADTGADAPPPLDPFVLLKEIIANLNAASDNAVALLRRAVELMSRRREELGQCPAHDALKLAIWSEKTRISPEELQRLGPLWLRYFQQETAPETLV